MTRAPLDGAVASTADLLLASLGAGGVFPDGLFPAGIGHYALGGALVGLGVVTIYVGTAIVPGASTFLESTLSYASDLSRFQRYTDSRDWRLVFTLGIVLGAALYAVVTGEFFTTDVQWWRLLAGGFLVGVGTRIGKGCTSGHGICGVGSRSKTSIVGVLTFLAIAVATAQIVAFLGVTP